MEAKQVGRGRLSLWLHVAWSLVKRRPLVWLGYTVLTGLILALCRISLAAGVFLSVTALFAGIAVAESVDRRPKASPREIVSAALGILPKAMKMALPIVVCWFSFRIAWNLYNDEPEKIARFFFDWEYTRETLYGMSFRQHTAWLFAGGVVALLFALLLVNWFTTWFSFPLSVYERVGWFAAKEKGTRGVEANTGVMYQLLGLLLFAIILVTMVLPLLTPVLYALDSLLMYVSYRDIFAGAAPAGNPYFSSDRLARE